MIADDLVSRFGASDRFFFDDMQAGLAILKASRQTVAGLAGLFTQFPRAGLEQRLGIVNHHVEITNQLVEGDPRIGRFDVRHNSSLLLVSSLSQFVGFPASDSKTKLGASAIVVNIFILPLPFICLTG